MALTLSTQQKQLLIGLLAVLAAVGWLVFFLIPKAQVLSQTRQEFAQLRPRLQRTQAQIGEISKLQAQLEQLQAEMEILEEVPLPEEQLPELLEAMAQMGRVAQVSLVSVRPQLDLSTLNRGLSGYLELPLKVEVVGGYHQIGSFLDALESSEHLVRVEGFQIQGSSGDIWHHKATLLLRAYLLPSILGEG